MAESHKAPPVAAYTRMDEGTVEDYALQGELAKPFIASNRGACTDLP